MLRNVRICLKNEKWYSFRLVDAKMSLSKVKYLVYLNINRLPREKSFISGVEVVLKRYLQHKKNNLY